MNVQRDSLATEEDLPRSAALLTQGTIPMRRVVLQFHLLVNSERQNILQDLLQEVSFPPKPNIGPRRLRKIKPPKIKR
jgi:hypothetical protein